MDANFSQVVPMSYEEKVAVYIKLPKIDLVKMLIECNRIIESIQPKTYQLQEEECDVCGCHPSVIIRTEHGKFCANHARYN